MAYILAVNPGLFANIPGMPKGSVFTATALLGLIAYVIIHAISGKFKEISVTMWVLAVLFVLRYFFI